MLKYCQKQHPLNIIKNQSNIIDNKSKFDDSTKVKVTTKTNEADLGRSRNLTNNNYL